MDYRHNIYKIGDDYNEVLRDYPVLKQFSTNYEAGYIFPAAEALNKYMGEGRYKMGDPFTADMLNKWLDKLEHAGILTEDQGRLKSERS